MDDPPTSSSSTSASTYSRGKILGLGVGVDLWGLSVLGGPRPEDGGEDDDKEIEEYFNGQALRARDQRKAMLAAVVGYERAIGFKVSRTGRERGKREIVVAVALLPVSNSLNEKKSAEYAPRDGPKADPPVRDGTLRRGEGR